MIVALLAVLGQLEVAMQSPRQTHVDSATKVKLIRRAQSAETEFLLEWRREWERNRDLQTTIMRRKSLHCHGDGTWPVTLRLNQIKTSLSRKAMCPIWLSERDDSVPDEAVAIDNGLRPEGRAKIKEERATLLRFLDSVATVAPESPWIAGQRVRLYVDQREMERADRVARSECPLDDAFCSMLVGYVAVSRGRLGDANDAFDRAIRRMKSDERCAYLDISPLLEVPERASYSKLPCAERDRINTRYWWLSDPLFFQPGNERLVTHLFRTTLVQLHSALTIDERFDWRVEYGSVAAVEMLLRYGLPAAEWFDRGQDLEHFGWLGFTDSSANASREYQLPRYHTTPPYAAALDLSKLESDDFAALAPRWNRFRRKWDSDWWPIEHFARAAPITALDYQAAVLRRPEGPLIVVATDPRSDLIADSLLSSYQAGLVSMSGPDDRGRRAAAVISPTTTIVLDSRPGVQVISTEVFSLERDSLPAERARFAIDAPDGLRQLASGAIALSDPVLFAEAPGAPLPESFETVRGRMLPSTAVPAGKVGIFVETYGIAPGEPVELAIKMTLEDRPGLWRRIAAKIGLRDPGNGSVLIRWRDDQPGSATAAGIMNGTPVQSRSIIVDMSRLKPGRYAMEVGVGRPGQPRVATRRELTIRDR